MNKADLEKVIAIAEEGSMAKAAQKLYISQPALSKCLTKVEEELGEVLFIRRPSGLTPTYASECFLKKAYQILRLYDELAIEFCELNKMRRGVLNVGAAERMGALVLPKVLGIFHSRYPNITINIVEGNSYSLEEDVARGALDTAIILLPVKNPNIQYRIFHRDPYYIAVPQEHPLNQKAYYKEGDPMPYLDIKELRGATVIVTTPRKKSRQIFNLLLDQLCGEYEIALETNNLETVVRFVAHNLGISVIPSIFARIYSEGERINYYQMEPGVRLFHEWAVIYNDQLENLTRPSRELFHILCDEGALFHEKLSLEKLSADEKNS